MGVLLEDSQELTVQNYLLNFDNFGSKEKVKQLGYEDLNIFIEIIDSKTKKDVLLVNLFNNDQKDQFEIVYVSIPVKNKWGVKGTIQLVDDWGDFGIIEFEFGSRSVDYFSKKEIVTIALNDFINKFKNESVQSI